ncbi:acyltransferase [Bacillus sp. BGMRC 2118]|nr:acyltransferase [Bacillus sp. BGMRC 2118]
MDNRQQLSSLQGIRALAALLVLVSHATAICMSWGVNYLGGIFYAGNLGVDLFFVLSGFIIFYIHHKDKNENGLVKKFFIKRFIRIYPIYWIALLILVPFELFIAGFGIAPENYYQIGTHIKAFLLYPQVYQPLSVSWTLTSEILFYMIFGVVLFSKFKKIAIGVFGVWVVASALTAFYVPTNYVVLCLLYPTNIEFVYGILVAYIVLNYKVKQGPLLIVTGTILSILAMANAIHGYIDIDRIFAFGIPSAMIVLGCVSLEFSRELNIPRVITYLGDASYSIYLTHFPALYLIHKLFVNLGLLNILHIQVLMTIVVIATVAFGCLFHSYIEKPLLIVLRKQLLQKKRPVVNEHTLLAKAAK